MMSTDITNHDSDLDTGTKPDTTSQVEPSTNKAKRPFYSQYLSLFKSAHSSKGAAAPKPVVKLSSRAWKSFKSLGVNLRGKPTPIDDRQGIVRDGIMYMSMVSKESAEELNITAMTLLSGKRPRATKDQFLATPTQEPLGKYPFARVVSEQHRTSNLPDSNLVFNRLLSCGDKAPEVGHPNCMSSLTFALASIISLSLVRVKQEKPDYNETSPFLDLTPLYGLSNAETDLIRIKDGSGMLYPDCFYEDRAMSLPQAVSVLLILWNRNHNYIARHLLLNNEGKKWVDPSSHPALSDDILRERLAEQDDDIFRKARSINCIQFKNVVSEDFLKVLVGLPNVGKSANLNVLADVKQSEKGSGCDSILEFSLLYNWSVLMGRVDVDRLKASEGVEIQTFDRQHQNYHGLKRNATGRFNDEDLAEELRNATENDAGTPGARRIPSTFRAAEVSIIDRARRQGVASLNQFRKYIGLKELKSFDEWNSNIEIAQAAKELYGDIDNLELYVGLQAEDIAEGSGLNFGYTMTYGLLVDLISIIRSDPCFTTELTPSNLTRWGHSDCTSIPNNGAFGAMLPKLLQRTLCRDCSFDNIYTLFPLTCPNETNQRLLSEFTNPQDLYDLERPKSHHVVPVETKSTISYVFNSPKFKTIYDNDLKTLTSGHGYFLGIEDKTRHDQELMMTMFALIPDHGALTRYAASFGATAAELISTQSKKENGHHTIDIVKDVINVTCTRWVCETLCGLRLREDIDDATDMHNRLGALFAYVFRNIDPENGWSSRAMALEASEDLRRRIAAELPDPLAEPDRSYLDFIRATVASVSTFISRISRELQQNGDRLSARSAQTFLDRVVKSAKNFPLDMTHLQRDGELIDLVAYEKEMARLEKSRSIANVLGLAVVTSINYAQACAQAVDFYLDDQYSEERQEIMRLSALNPLDSRKQDANKKIMGYIREAQRLGQRLGLWREACEDDNIPQEYGLPSISVKAGDRVFADFNKAHTNRQDFLYPESVDPNRSTPSIQGMGLHKCPGLGFVDHTMPELFKAIFRLKNLRRDPGKAGRLQRLTIHPEPKQTDPLVFMDSTGEISHFPRSLTLLFDDVTHEGAALKAKKRKSWKVEFGSSTRRLREATDRWLHQALVALLIILLLLVLSFVYSHLPSFSRPSVPRTSPQQSSYLPTLHVPSFLLPSWYLPSFLYRWIWGPPRKTRKPRAPPPKSADIVAPNVDCPLPTTVFQPWDINTFVLGEDGHPDPIEYTLNSDKPHRLSVVDIDAMDTQMAVYVDGMLRGVTRDFELNKTNSCGESQSACVKGGFSAGVVVVAPGNHTVKIDWTGKEYANGTHDADWGEEKGRRIKWKREYCS